MQVKNIEAIVRLNRRALSFLFRFLVTGLCLLFVVRKLLRSDISLATFDTPPAFEVVILTSLLLMIINWFLEIYRWKLSITPFERIDFKTASRDVFIGMALNWVLPFTAGDAAARLVAKEDKYRSSAALLLNRFLMLAMTIALGVYGFWVYGFEKINRNENVWIIAAIALLFLAVATLLKKHFQRFWNYFTEQSPSFYFRIISISVFRYLIFSFQLFIFFCAFLPELPTAVIVGGVGWVFFFRSAIPSLLGGIGLREAASITFFQTMVSEASLVVFPVFLLWIINTVIPSLLGALLISQKPGNSWEVC